MHHIQRVRGIKYDLSTFSVAELAAAVVHARRSLDEQQRYLAALLREQGLRCSTTGTATGSPQEKDMPGPVACAR